MPTLLKEDAARYCIIKEASSSQQGISLHPPNSQLRFFFPSIQRNTIEYIHKQQTKQARDNKRTNYCCYQTNESEKDKLYRCCPSSRSQTCTLKASNPSIACNSSLNHILIIKLEGSQNSNKRRAKSAPALLNCSRARCTLATSNRR